MGCDIHFVVEQRTENHGWIGILRTGCPLRRIGAENRLLGYADRDYNFFGLLAGVRRPSKKSLEPLGVPNDASAMARMEIGNWGSDGHTPSWCSLLDFVRLKLQSNETTNTVAVADRLRGEDPVLKVLDPDGWYTAEFSNPDNFRVVFWFDN